MPQERFKLITAVHLFLIKNGEVLLLRRFKTGYEDGNYGVPAGHHDGNEPARQSIARETLEEVGIKINPEDLKMAHVMHKYIKDTSDERIDFFFTTDTWTGEPFNAEPKKCDDLRWFPLNNLPNNMIDYVKASLNNYLNSIPFSEYGWGNKQ